MIRIAAVIAALILVGYAAAFTPLNFSADSSAGAIDSTALDSGKVAFSTIKDCNQLRKLLDRIACKDSIDEGKSYLVGDNPMRDQVQPATPVTPYTGGEYLQRAGYHWLISIGLGVGAFAIGSAKDWKGQYSLLIKGVMVGAVGFQLAVPFDLIFAGKAFGAR